MNIKFGRKIFDKIIAATKPDEALGEDPINVFDPEFGADFMLKQTVVSGYPNYDSSQFSSKKPISGGKARIDEVLSQCFDLSQEVTPDKFKTAEELKSKFDWVMGGSSGTAKNAEEKDYDSELDELTKLAETKPKEEKKPRKAPPVPVATEEDTDDSDAAFFAALAND